MPLQMLGLGLFSMWQLVVVAQGNSTAKRDPHWGWILAMIVQMLLTLLAIVLIFAVILGGFAALLGSMPRDCRPRRLALGEQRRGRLRIIIVLCRRNRNDGGLAYGSR